MTELLLLLTHHDSALGHNQVSLFEALPLAAVLECAGAPSLDMATNHNRLRV